jgi:hypothetical protein
MKFSDIITPEIEAEYNRKVVEIKTLLMPYIDSVVQDDGTDDDWKELLREKAGTVFALSQVAKDLKMLSDPLVLATLVALGDNLKRPLDPR